MNIPEEIEIINLTTYQSLNIRIRTKITQVFLETAEKEIQFLKKAENFREITQIAHKLKGSSSVIGADRLVFILDKIEKSDSIDEMHRYIKLIHSEHEKCAAELKYMISLT